MPPDSSVLQYLRWDSAVLHEGDEDQKLASATSPSYIAETYMMPFFDRNDPAAGEMCGLKERSAHPFNFGQSVE
jgi:hypothetical protein